LTAEDSRERFNLHIPRQKLREFLFRKIDHAVCHVRWNHRFLKFEASAHSVRLHFSNQTAQDVDLLVVK
jgi:2-polyprenyl-6-methoxyphenol hydroxylase-like FAD-dependent oxidoreductase